MLTTFRANDTYVWFVLEGLESRYRDAASRMHFEPVHGGFGRRFPVDAPFLEDARANFAHHAEAMIRQQAGEVPVKWEETLLALLNVNAGEDLNWYLVGSAALAVRGLAVAPGDLDLVLDVPGAHRLGALLRDRVVEPVAPTEGWVAACFCRAYLGSSRVEWLGGANERADEPLPSDFGPAAAERLETVDWRGYVLQVPPLEMQLAVCERRGRDQTAAAIRQAMGIA